MCFVWRPLTVRLSLTVRQEGNTKVYDKITNVKMEDSFAIRWPQAYDLNEESFKNPNSGETDPHYLLLRKNIYISDESEHQLSTIPIVRIHHFLNFEMVFLCLFNFADYKIKKECCWPPAAFDSKWTTVLSKRPEKKLQIHDLNIQVKSYTFK